MNKEAMKRLQVYVDVALVIFAMAGAFAYGHMVYANETIIDGCNEVDDQTLAMQYCATSRMVYGGELNETHHFCYLGKKSLEFTTLRGGLVEV